MAARLEPDNVLESTSTDILCLMLSWTATKDSELKQPHAYPHPSNCVKLYDARRDESRNERIMDKGNLTIFTAMCFRFGIVGFEDITSKFREIDSTAQHVCHKWDVEKEHVFQVGSFWKNKNGRVLRNTSKYHWRTCAITHETSGAYLCALFYKPGEDPKRVAFKGIAISLDADTLRLQHDLPFDLQDAQVYADNTNRTSVPPHVQRALTLKNTELGALWVQLRASCNDAQTTKHVEPRQAVVVRNDTVARTITNLAMVSKGMYEKLSIYAYMRNPRTDTPMAQFWTHLMPLYHNMQWNNLNGCAKWTSADIVRRNTCHHVYIPVATVSYYDRELCKFDCKAQAANTWVSAAESKKVHVPKDCSPSYIYLRVFVRYVPMSESLRGRRTHELCSLARHYLKMATGRNSVCYVFDTSKSTTMENMHASLDRWYSTLMENNQATEHQFQLVRITAQKSLCVVQKHCLFSTLGDMNHKHMIFRQSKSPISAFGPYLYQASS